MTRRNPSAASSSPGSPMMSVSTGTPPVSVPIAAPGAAWRLSSASALSRMSFSPATPLSSAIDVVHLDIVAPLLVERIAFPGALLVAFVGGDDLEDAIERRKEGRPFNGASQEHVVVRQRLSRGGEDDRRLGSHRGADEAVRHEARGLERPQRAIEIREHLRIRRIHHHAALAIERGGREPAGETDLVLGVAVEIDPRHAARRTRKCERRATGRPVAPFSAPDFHAVPAMSRCAHGYALVNRERQHAAVIEPPAREPMLGMSAKFDLSASW